MKNQLIFILAIVLLVGCGKQSSKTEKPTITVSILPQKYIVEQIAKDYFDVNVMVVAGASPATYSPTPKQMTQLDKSEAYLKIGHIGYEQTWMKKVKAIHRNLDIVDTSKGVKLIYGMEEQHGDHVHLHGIDPHIWMAPHTFRKVAENTFSALKKLAPKKEEEFQKGLEQLLKKIDQLHKIGQQELANKKGRTFMIFHPALGYLAREFQLNQLAMEVDGKEPSAKHLTHIVDEAKKEGIKVIFIQKEFSTDQASMIAKEIDGKVTVINPLAYNWPEEMEKIIRNLAQALN
ncbi:zinc ABC transporter substrate-binding protein [Prolixibacteraceae bacterium JC049]|nr:zinc ABC transporter substrate-binding protein [Prolixibacteraceae bacterium JC049]